MRAWNDWYHCTGNTYGTWLPYSPSGWRTRKHRDHVEGDYKNPPHRNSLEKERHERARDSLQRPPVALCEAARFLVCEVMREVLHFHGIEVKAIAVDDHHFHVIARFPASNARHLIGIAKKRTARRLSDGGLVAPGGVWAKRSRAAPVSDASHLRNAIEYVRRHAEKGAATWCAPEDESA